MRFLTPFLLLSAAAPSLPAQTTGIGQSSDLITVPEGDKFLRWHGHTGRSYFVQISDTDNPLRKWHWATIIEAGNDGEISYEVGGTAPKGFFRLKYTDQLPGPNETLETADFDGDGISNIDEIDPPPPLSAGDATDPLASDSDHDGLIDGWERANGFDSNNADEDHNGIPDGSDDRDGDGISNAGEADAGTDPNDPNDSPTGDWLEVTGDLPKDQPKSVSRTYKIKKGDSRVLVVGTSSQEYPDFTGGQSQWNDKLEWEFTLSPGAAITGSIHVNERHEDWEIDEINGVTLNGHGPSAPVHIEKVKVIQAPADADVTVEVKLTATNVNDGILPSTVIAGLLPIRIEPDDGMSGVIGGKVESSKSEGGEKHFVTPKSATAGDYVNLKAIRLEEAWITPGDPNQLVEWDPAVGQSNGAATKWKVKRDAAEKFPVKLRTIAKYGHEEAKKLNVWVTWATLELKDDTPEMQPSNDSGGTFTLNAKIAYKYTCQPNAMFDLAQDVPNFNLPPAPPAPGGNHPWALHKPLAEGAAIRYDATRQVRAVLKSSDSVFLDWQHQHEETPDIPNYPTDIAEGNDDPNIKGEGIPYQGEIDTQGMMQDVDSPFYTLDHTLGLPDATFLMQAQFRQYARVQIAGKWFQCSDLELSDLKFKFKKTNGKWTDDPDDRSSFVKGNSTFPPP